MIVAISGSNGFIGSHLKKYLSDKGHTIYSIPREYLYAPKFLTKYIQTITPDYVYHLASYGNMYHQTDKKEIYRANVTTTANLLQANIENSAILTIVSSSSVHLPLKTHYSVTKGIVERLCNEYVRKYRKIVNIIRPYSVYGTNEAPYRFIPTVFRSCLNDEPIVLAPGPVHDWIYIDDLIERMVLYAEQAIQTDNNVRLMYTPQNVDNYCEAFDIGTGISTSNIEVVGLIEQITKRQARIKEYRDMRSFDNGVWVAPYKDPDMVPLHTGLRRIYKQLG